MQVRLDQQTPLELNGDFNHALDFLERGEGHMFITGRAGTGKSTFLRLFRSLTRLKTVVLAPTGIAALNIQGQTIHSFFGFPPRLLNNKDIKKRRDRRLYKNLDIIIIDEVSMVRADLLDNIDYFLRLNRDSLAPFGGVRMLFIGDLFQLPPVVASEAESRLFSARYDSPYFFSAEVMKNLPLEYLELAKVYRQHNARFLRLLDAIRLNRFDREELAEFNERYVPDFHNPGDYLTLTARNARADSINQSELERLPGPAKAYAAKVRGEFNAAVFPADPMLRLKVDAQVMLLKNDYEAGFVNGDIGRVFSLEEDRVVVEIGQPGDASRLVEVGPAEWDIIRYKVSEEDPGKIESEIVGIFEQVPLRLAWAVTIHKAQGKTFDRVIIDLGRGAFEHGQTYVALSRCRTLEGIVLRQPLRPSDVLIDQRVVDYYQQHFL